MMPCKECVAPVIRFRAMASGMKTATRSTNSAHCHASDDVQVPSSALEAALDPALVPTREQTTATPTRLFSPRLTVRTRNTQRTMPFHLPRPSVQAQRKDDESCCVPASDCHVIVSVVLVVREAWTTGTRFRPKARASRMECWNGSCTAAPGSDARRTWQLNGPC